MSKKKETLSLKDCSLRKQAKLISGNGSWNTFALPECSIESIQMNDGPCGLRIPSLNSNDSNLETSLKATAFPTPSLLACSWDLELMKEVGASFANEAIEKGTDVLLAPGINIKRNPLCGRNFEYYSEDPLLAGELGASFINGLQENGVGACLKHFAANNSEYHRLTSSSEVDMRALREIYLKGFEIAIKKSNPWSVMCSYNRLNGVYASQNEWLLDQVLRKEWGYEGLLMSDWGAVLDPVLAHARGLDLEMPCFEKTRPSLLSKAAKKGKLPKNKILEEADRVATLSKKVQEAKKNRSKERMNNGHEVALKAALNSIVLAKNDGILPLKSFADVSVIGPFAKEPHFQGFGSSHVNTEHLTIFFEEASKKLGKPLSYAKGYDPYGKENEEALRLDAVDLASTSKAVLLFLGTNYSEESEGFDRRDMRLDERQIRLFEAIAAQNENIILVLSSGAPLEIPFIAKCRAVFIEYLAGEAEGEALYSLMSGEKNPCGHLAESWPIRYIDCPSALFYPGESDVSLYKESVFVGYRYYLSAKRDVLFPFGFGLSYTDFSLTNFKVSRESLREGQKVKVSVKVTNIGDREGSSVIQCYLGAKSEKTMHPLRELKAFEKVFLAPGKAKTVTFEFSYDAFSHFGVTSESWVVNDDEYSIDLGLNCRDISFSKTIKVNSGHHSRDNRFVLPSYFRFASNGAWRVSDDEFEILLDHSVFKNVRKKKKKNSRNSAFKEIEHTFIGKKLKKRIIQLNESSSSDDGYKERNLPALMDLPIRFALTMGYSERTLSTIISLANKNLLGALFHLIFG